MCGTCGCSSPARITSLHHSHAGHESGHVHAPESPQAGRTVQLQQKVLAKNDDLAAGNRQWLHDRGVVVIENASNLVCPALFDLGEAARVVLALVTEGADKPLKYPHMFRQDDLV